MELNTDQDSAIIAIIEEELNADGKGKRKHQDVNQWIERFWSRQGYNSNNSGGDVQSLESNGRTDAIYGNASQLDSGRGGEGSGKANQDAIQLNKRDEQNIKTTHRFGEPFSYI
jgi:hypothetical protein